MSRIANPSYHIANERAEDHPTLDVLLFRLEREIYAIPSSNVREVVRFRSYTPVPGAPSTLPGILSQRGQIVPVVELRPLLGLTTDEITRSARFVMVVQGDVQMAMLVDAVLDLTKLPSDEIEPAPVALDPSRARFLRGIARYEGLPVALLELDELIASLREWA